MTPFPGRKACLAPAMIMALVFLLVPGATAQQPGGAVAGKHAVDVSVRLSRDGVRRNSTIAAALILNIRQGWHINSAKPSDEMMIATSAEPKPLSGVSVSGIRYPPGVEAKVGFSDAPLSVYTGSATIFLQLKISDSLTAGHYILPVDVTYQACNDNMCLPPSTIRVDVPIRVVPPEEPVKDTDPGLFRGLVK